MTAMTCIVCPRGCRMKVQETDDGIVVAGNKCKRGIPYGISELKSPLRILTTTVRISDGAEIRLPVKTDKPIPKDMLFEAMREIDGVSLRAPVLIGDIVIRNILGTGSNIIATREIVRTTGGHANG